MWPAASAHDSGVVSRSGASTQKPKPSSALTTPGLTQNRSASMSSARPPWIKTNRPRSRCSSMIDSLAVAAILRARAPLDRGAPRSMPQCATVRTDRRGAVLVPLPWPGDVVVERHRCRRQGSLQAFASLRVSLALRAASRFVEAVRMTGGGPTWQDHGVQQAGQPRVMGGCGGGLMTLSGEIPVVSGDGPSPAGSRSGMGAVAHAEGVTFRVWAPFATAVSVAGSFNGWSADSHPLSPEGGGCGPSMSAVCGRVSSTGSSSRPMRECSGATTPTPGR